MFFFYNYVSISQRLYTVYCRIQKEFKSNNFCLQQNPTYSLIQWPYNIADVQFAGKCIKEGSRYHRAGRDSLLSFSSYVKEWQDIWVVLVTTYMRVFSSPMPYVLLSSNEYHDNVIVSLDSTVNKRFSSLYCKLHQKEASLTTQRTGSQQHYRLTATK